MTRKLISLLLTLLLCTLPALAEEAVPCDAVLPRIPTQQDFFGCWDVVYIVTDGTGTSREPGVSRVVVTEELATFSNGENVFGEYAYSIQGDTMYVDGITMQWVGEGVMLCRFTTEYTTVGVMHRTALSGNPFLGDWEVVMYFRNGCIIEPCTTMMTFAEEAVSWDPEMGGETVTHAAAYDAEGCYFNDRCAVIDQSGAMVITGWGEVLILLPIIY